MNRSLLYPKEGAGFYLVLSLLFHFLLALLIVEFSDQTRLQSNADVKQGDGATEVTLVIEPTTPVVIEQGKNEFKLQDNKSSDLGSVVQENNAGKMDELGEATDISQQIEENDQGIQTQNNGVVTDRQNSQELDPVQLSVSAKITYPKESMPASSPLKTLKNARSQKIIAKGVLAQSQPNLASVAKKNTGAKQEAPKIFENPPPVYPEASRQKRESGKVIVCVHILATGKVAATTLQKSSNYPMLDKAALDAVMKWRFAPTQTPILAALPVNFELKDLRE